ncbi:hypothetical protein BGZ99_010292 [Dissophora globulifera]|uniref:ABC transporter domain-containing protein n=1 Tax=Dissophora globulifera TaxID=979702 RepID=A0A9P6RST0_9FUNG|nr:hypothetical protein BGZ99_010292 [Dissophora globulifera]
MSQPPQPPDAGEGASQSLQLPEQPQQPQQAIRRPGGILRNVSSYQNYDGRRHQSIIPPPSMDSEDDDDEEDEVEITPDEAYQNALGGRWGEGPSRVDVINAERDFRQLERTLTSLSQPSSLGTAGAGDQGPGRRRGSRKPSYRPPSHKEPVPELSAAEQAIKQEDEFDLETHLKKDVLPQQEAKGIKIRTMGVSWRQLSVIGEGVGQQYIATTGTPFVMLFNIVNPVHWIRKCMGRAGGPKKVSKTILYPMDGCCQEGEMILVLGRPGSGCSTLLRVLANDRKHYKKVLGNVTYNNLSAETVHKHYKGDVLYNQEGRLINITQSTTLTVLTNDFHYPTLTVRQTLETAIKAKTPRARLPGLDRRRDFRERFLDVLTKMYGLTRQKDTLVGNAFIRGISGGERKRLSIAEQMATRSSINMWDGSTRGLDASSALDYVKSLRVQTNLLRRATMVSIYQASENIYDLFDKVLLLYDGRCIFYGPSETARQYFIDMGFDCPARQTTADFLTAVTDPHERKPAAGLPPSVASNLPSTPDQFWNLYKQSIHYDQTHEQLTEYEARMDSNAVGDEFMAAAKQEKQKHVSVDNPFTITYVNQVLAMAVRQIQLIRGDWGSLATRYMVVQAAIVGTCFLLLPTTVPGKSQFAINQTASGTKSELPAALEGRPILYKLKNYAMYRPSSFGLAQVLIDIPVITGHVFLFSFVLYFTSGLQKTAGKFFLFVFILFLTTGCMTSFFRMWGCASKTFDDATKYSGIVLLAFILYSGYLIPYQAMHGWFIWIFWINPLAYAFKGLMSNEMGGLVFTCDPPYLIPYGPGYDNLANQVCTLAGSQPGKNTVDGVAYMYSAFRYKASQLWIDIAALICFWILFAALTALAMETKEFGKGGFSTNVFKKTKATKASGPGFGAGGRIAPAPDEERGMDPNAYETQPNGVPVAIANSNTEAKIEEKEEPMIAKSAVFSWENLDYVVPYKADPSGKKQLLNHITGLVKPGTMTALMGSSGAGKTTLLDVLAQRKSIGTVTGQIEVDGRPLRRDFQRTTGYCEQLDVHVPEATVREALRFSANLRQPAHISEAEKNAYVEEIIGILEMEGIADAEIGTTESGLGISVEERKRLTIGVELVAKPKLLFLDEPTSGLDAQASYNIMRFMRKLTNQGQAILCTIHQPSSQLFEFFDDLLLLAKGGKTVYFGHLGRDSSQLIEYFEKNGAPKCAEDANPAEYILDVVNSRHSDLNWPNIWNESSEKQRLLVDIQETRAAALANPDDYDHTAELEYATNTATQFKYVFRRMTKTFWRLPSYNLGRLGLMILFALLNGFTFYRLKNSIVAMQSRVFVIFQILVLAPLLCNTVEPRFMMERQWFYREQSGKYYNWFPFAVSIILVEMPYIIVFTTVFFCALYWTVGLVTNGLSTFYTYLMTIIFTLFAITLGQMIAAWTPSPRVAAVFNPFVISVLNLFCGIVMPYTSMPGFWKAWLYWLDPYHYIVEGMIATQLFNLPVICNTNEFNIFQPPAGQTCGAYIANFLETAPGYVNNPDASADCQYCQYSVGQEFYAKLNMSFGHRWRNLGFACMYLVANIVIIMLGVRFYKAAKR